MKRKIKYGKVAIVIAITVLIWVWADLALNRELPVSNVTIMVAKSIDPKLLVTFNDEPAVSIAIEKITLKGPASKIADVERKLHDGSLVFEFFFDPEQEGMTGPGKHRLNVPNFLKKTDKIRQHGLTVESCEPDTISVNVVELIKKPLPVKCFDKEQIPIEDATIEPAQVEMFVPDDWVGDAKVLLTLREVEHARLSAIEKTPYIELVAGQPREASRPVKITTPPEEDLLEEDTIIPALGFTLSVNLQGKYNIKMDNLPDIIGPIRIRATPEAKQAYENMRYQVILEIDEEDAKSAEILRRELFYNFPDDYLRRGEIELKGQPVEARFKLVPLTPTEAGPGR